MMIHWRCLPIRYIAATATALRVFNRVAHVFSIRGFEGGSTMKQLFLAGVASVVMAGSAFAADMAVKAPPPVLAYDWSGFYIGGVIGGAWGHIDSSDPGLGLLGTLINVPVVQTTTNSGFIGGIEG